MPKPLLKPTDPSALEGVAYPPLTGRAPLDEIAAAAEILLCLLEEFPDA